MYYLRTRPAADALQFTVDQKAARKVLHTEEGGATARLAKKRKAREEAAQCLAENGNACVMCSS
jgi:ribonucleoside-diphosphate reductase subunit M1